MAVTAQLVKELREMTGAGMMDCKKILVETDGDIEKAVELLREKGLAKAAKKSGRIAAMGLVRTAISADGKEAALVEVNSETDFVAKNADFVEFVEKVSEKALEAKPADVESFMEVEFYGEGTLKEALTNKIATIGENMNVRRFACMNEPGVLYAGYVHGNGLVACLVGIKTDASLEDIQVVGKDVAMQVASMNPKFLKQEDIDPEFREKEASIIKEQTLNEGLPAERVDQIVQGRLAKELKEYCLLEQKFVKDNKLTVKAYVEEVAKAAGKSMEVVSFVRFEVGEGIEKKEEDFAAEVAAQQAAVAGK